MALVYTHDSTTAMQYRSAFQPTWYAVCSRCLTRRYDSSTICDRTTTSLMRWRHCTRPRTRAVRNRGANFQSASRQRAAISGTSCRRRWPTRSASSAVSKYQPPSRAAHQAVCYWQPCFSGCRISSLERSATGRRLIVIIADFPPSITNSSFSTFIPSPKFFDRLTGIVKGKRGFV